MGIVNALRIVLFMTAVAACSACGFHPSFWCSSKEIAKKCEVVEQCYEFVWSRNAVEEDADRHYWDSAKPVEIGFYYETLCPDCKDFVKSQLGPTYKAIPDIFRVDFVPYGNAREHEEGGEWVFHCQHGDEECFENIIHTCALNLYPSNVTFPFIVCMEASKDHGKSCALKYGLSYTKLVDCAHSPEGNQWQHEMAQKTDNLNPPHTFVPWITIDGVHTDDIQDAATTDLLGLICKTYKGSKPHACQQTKKNFGCMKNF